MNPVAPRNVINGLACAMTMKHECLSSIAFCIPLVALHDANDVSYVPKIIFLLHFSCQVQYLVKLQSSCSQVAHSVFVAGAIFGEVAVKLQTRNVVFFDTKCAWEPRKATSVVGRVAHCMGFMLGSFSTGPAL